MPSILESLLSPIILAFLLGMVAALARSELSFPDQIYKGLTIYLLFAMGLKGGANLSEASWNELCRPILSGVILSAAAPFWCYALLRRLGRLPVADAAAIAAHYASVSVATFAACLAFFDARQISSEGFLPAVLAVMEVPGILVALALARLFAPQPGSGSLKQVCHQLFTGKAAILLIGGLLIGLFSGREGFAQVSALFEAPFRGVLALFLLEAGLTAGRHLRDLRQAGFFLVTFAVTVPLVHGIMGVVVGKWAGLSLGGATMLGTLAASASYIAAPASVRTALPQASPALYLTSSLAVTFPFNVIFGIPIYFSFAQRLYG